jgi:anti-sigma-K factor RskA
MTDDAYQLLAAYAVDAVTDEEREQVERYLRAHPEHLPELRSLQRTVAELSAELQVAPPPSLRDSVLAQAHQIRPLPPQEPTAASLEDEHAAKKHTDQPRDELAARRRKPWFIAAAAAAVIGVTTVAVQQQIAPPSQQTVVAQVSAAADARSYELAMPGHSATVTRSMAMGKAVFRSSDLGAAPAGHAYQVWLQQPDGSMVSAGVLPGPTSGVVQMVLHGDATRAVGVGLTMEPAGGSTKPSSAPLAVAGF